MDRIERFLRLDPALHAYELGDLDPRYAGLVDWFAAPDDGPVEAVALVYRGSEPPTLLCFGGAAAQGLLASITLPPRLYAHLSPGLRVPGYDAEPHGRHLKLALRSVPAGDDAGVEVLGPDRAEELGRFYAVAYPGNWFDPRMLAIEPAVGVRDGDALVAVAGLHVFSERHRVAALGNVAVLPALRGRGLGTRVTGALVRRLAGRVDTLALNVRADNSAAIATYRRLGFTVVAEYDEVALFRGRLV